MSNIKTDLIRHSPEDEINKALDYAASDIIQHSKDSLLEDKTLVQQLLFLQTENCNYSPHTAHFILLDKKIVLIILSQVSKNVFLVLCVFCFFNILHRL